MIELAGMDGFLLAPRYGYPGRIGRREPGLRRWVP